MDRDGGPGCWGRVESHCGGGDVNLLILLAYSRIS